MPESTMTLPTRVELTLPAVIAGAGKTAAWRFLEFRVRPIHGPSRNSNEADALREVQKRLR